MKKIFTYSILGIVLLFNHSIFAQQKPIPEGFLPEAGSTAVGFSINPIAGIRVTNLFKDNAFVGNTIASTGSLPHQMFLLAQEPMASIRVKHKLSNVIAVKGSVGFSGGYFNYQEYVADDQARLINPLSEDVVADAIKFNMASGGVSVGIEFTGGERKLRFVGGVNLLYAFGGGKIKFDYGNEITAFNQVPTCMPLITDSLNNFQGGGGLQYARPLERYNIGFEHGVGLSCDLGLEWFIVPRLSLGAAVTFTPIMVVFQPQTYTIFEGYSSARSEVVEYNKLVSPGSTYLLYGTENLGMSLSIHYYFK